MGRWVKSILPLAQRCFFTCRLSLFADAVIGEQRQLWRADRPPYEAGHFRGQQQRAGIARAFIARPDFVFADEPTGNLDSKTTVEIMEMICGFARTYHQTIVLVTHDPEMASYADRVVHLIDSAIVGDEIQKRR